MVLKKSERSLTWREKLIQPLNRPLPLFILFEVLALGGTFALYVRTNRDPNFRYTLYKHPTYSKILDAWYYIGDIYDSKNENRRLDKEYWAQQGKEL